MSGGVARAMAQASPGAALLPWPCCRRRRLAPVALATRGEGWHRAAPCVKTALASLSSFISVVHVKEIVQYLLNHGLSPPLAQDSARREVAFGWPKLRK